jgi:formamidopyrimidine-DNA glycosylase
MPELPEVETIVKGLNEKLKGRKIIDLWSDWPKYFRRIGGEKSFRKHIIGKKILGFKRRGKNVLIALSDNHLLLVHQKMSGHLLIGRWKKNTGALGEKFDENEKEKWVDQKWIPDPPKGSLLDPMNRFIRLIFFLDNKKMLALSDLRRFAKILCGPIQEIMALPDLHKLGPEPLEIGLATWQKLFAGKRGRLKQVLMDQNFVVGIGNIYADEILWLAKIHPLEKVESLKEKDLKKLFTATQKILKKAIRLRGSSIDDYRDALGRLGTYHLSRYAYQRDGESCSRCGTLIKRIKVGGRGTHFCPKCQKLVK